MENLSKVLASVISSYDNKNRISYQDLRTLDLALGNEPHKTFAEILESMISTYNCNEVIKFEDLISLDRLIGAEHVLVESLIISYDHQIKLNYIQVKSLEEI